MNKSYLFFYLFLASVTLSCSNNSDVKPLIKEVKTSKWIKVDDFNSDSAYNFISKQVSFGPRVPNTINHKKCGDWIVNKLTNYGFKTKEQVGQVTAFNGSKLPVRNIIGNINPNATKKVLLCAHWDTRPFADRDSLNKNRPIIGANDGASGVGVILEIARTFKKDSLNIGLEIIFFDVEDYGAPSLDNSFFDLQSMNDTWCLGSQYWCYNLNANYKKPNFGILLDMVGAKGAVFTKEEISRKYAGYHLNKVWKLAEFLGYGDYFQKRIAPPITDDHTYINQLTLIPTIDIIHYDLSPYSGRFDFGRFHHTHQDNMEIIDKKTLNAVGHTVLSYLHNI
tara:strand:+ start:1511 stop:2521 length:1011 start_codon:yes stop_codon:yes gene_type:complete